jgi:hypothetical protein
MPAPRQLIAALTLGAIAATSLLAPVEVAAYETDQYHQRELPLRDALPALDLLVNDGLRQVAERWRGPRDDVRFARKVYWQLGGFHWVDKVERFAMRSAEVERLPRHGTIYRYAPLFAGRVIFFFGICDTVQVGGTRLGTDKLGHFFSQGMKYFRRERHGWSEGRFIGWASKVEALIFGELTTGVFSNADLVANYEGYLFYRSLFEDGVAGKPAIVAFENGRARIVRPFTFADHVNGYWDEALNPSYLGKQLQRHVARILPELCADYRRNPALWVAADADALDRRYAHIGMKEAPFNRLDRVCGGSGGLAQLEASNSP